jgi:hypothetical protein
MLRWGHSMNPRPFVPLGKRVSISFFGTKEIEKGDSPVFAGLRLADELRGVEKSEESVDVCQVLSENTLLQSMAVDRFHNRFQQSGKARADTIRSGHTHACNSGTGNTRRL